MLPHHGLRRARAFGVVRLLRAPRGLDGSDLFVWTLAPDGASSAGRYDPRADRWFPADPPPRAASRRESASVWLDCALYVVGGRDVTRWAFTREVIRWVP